MLVTHESMPRHDRRILRPNIMMWGDMYYIWPRDQEATFETWKKELPDTAVVIGSNHYIPTNLDIAKRFQAKGVKVICINPDPKSCGTDTTYLTPDVHLVTGAIDGLTRLHKGFLE